MNKIYEKALMSKDRKKDFWMWFLPILIILSIIGFNIIGWFSLAVSPIVALYSVKEKLMVYSMTDEEVKEELKQID